MRTEPAKTDAFTIFDADGFDPILVVFQDLGDGRGRLLIECYGWAWACYWGAMGTTVRDFVDQCHAGYVADRLTNNQRRNTAVEIKRLTGIVNAVKAAIRQQNLSASLETSVAHPDDETPCPKREDGLHCECWYGGNTCCGCGDGDRKIGEANLPTCAEVRAMNRREAHE